MKKFFLMFLVVMFVFSCGSDDTTDSNNEGENTETQCSQTNLNGSCKDGESCVNGECKIICSKDATDGYCEDKLLCVEGECRAECSKDAVDGYCENKDQICIEGDCQYNMEGITLSVINSDGNTVKEFKTSKEGDFEINLSDLSGSYTITYKKNTGNTILDKYQGIIDYSDIKITHKTVDFTTSFSNVFIDKFDKEKKLIELDNKEKFSILIKGNIAVYECIPKKNLGEPVTGAEIYIAQDPNTEPMAKSKTGENGEFCFGENCTGIKISFKTDKANNDKSGFAIGGYRLDKSKDNNKKGGFAIGGYRLDKNGEYEGYSLSISGNILRILTPVIVDTNEEGIFLINHFNLEKLSPEVPDTLLFKANSNIVNWDYTCKN